MPQAEAQQDLAEMQTQPLQNPEANGDHELAARHDKQVCVCVCVHTQ